MLKKTPGSFVFSFTSIYFILLILLVVSFAVALRTGAVNLSYRQILDILLSYSGIKPNANINPVDEGLFMQIRLPRILMCAMVGAALAVSGTLMQALFRNPIIEPGLIGTSAGAALGSAAVIVFGYSFKSFSHSFVAAMIMPLVAFIGALSATLIVYKLASVYNKINVSTMILMGVAVNAIANGGTGFLSYISRDPQARSITFWSLGTFAGVEWSQCAIVVFPVGITIFISLFYAKGLNALLLGDAEARALGINTESLKIRVIIINTLMVSVATSMVGVISFVGLIVPHILRMIKSSDNRYLIIASALSGAIFMILADAFSRIIIAPGELPIGILTALMGAPVFIYILLKQSRNQNKGGFYA